MSNDPLIDRYLTSRFITDIFPPRFFFLGVPADNTWRRCELMEWVAADTQETTEATKRIFRKIYTLSMESEMLQSQIVSVAKVRDLHIDIYDLKSVDPSGNLLKEPADHLWNDPHKVAVSNITEFAPSGS